MAIIILLCLFQITVLSLKKNILHACSSRTCRPLLHPRPLSTLRIPGYPTLVAGICTSTNISASKIPPPQDSDLVNTLGGKRAPFPNHLGSFIELFPIRHDARLDCPPQQCRQLRELVLALLDQLFGKPHRRIVKTVQSSTLLLWCFHILLHHTQAESSGWGRNVVVVVVVEGKQ